MAGCAVVPRVVSPTHPVVSTPRSCAQRCVPVCSSSAYSQPLRVAMYIVPSTTSGLLSSWGAGRPEIVGGTHVQPTCRDFTVAVVMAVERLFHDVCSGLYW